MRTPSTSDLVHAEANKAYDKLAVISENIEALREIYDVIFDIQEWLRQKLKDYVSIDVDQSIDSVKSFNQEPRLIGAKYYSNLDALENIGRTYATYINGNPALCFEVTRTEPSSNSNLTNDVVYTDKAYLIFNEDTKKFHLDIPPTIGTDDYSSVRVDYLNQRLSELQLDASQEIQAALAALEFDDTPTDGSSNPVTSDGIYHFIMNLLTYGPVADEATNLCTGHTIYWAIHDAIAGLSPGGSTYTLPHASDERLGGIKVGDYLTINSNGVLSVDIDALAAVLGIGGTDTSGNSYDTFFSLETTWDTEYTSSTYVRSIGIKLPVARSRSGSGNSYLYPSILGAELGVVRTDTVYLDETVTCKNTATQVTNKYVPVRYIVTWNSIQGGGSGNATYGGLHIKVWFRNYSYTLTAEDKTTINQEGTTFLNDHTGIGHQDTGAYPI